jgi:hypothetical protein
MVNTGLDITELLDPAQKRTNKGEAELMHSEIITNILQERPRTKESTRPSSATSCDDVAPRPGCRRPRSPTNGFKTSERFAMTASDDGVR